MVFATGSTEGGLNLPVARWSKKLEMAGQKASMRKIYSIVSTNILSILMHAKSFFWNTVYAG